MFNPLKFVQSVKQEAFKVTWPSKRDVMIGSLMVFVLATIASIFFLLLDQIYRFLLDIILNINIQI
jgi:preprotein translocase subunit SecE|tara:strand:+ start:966 stop:1163 length:198 start_codon:yes stop_codon:yes gene_type:complete